MDSFDWLLRPYDREQFFRENWECQSLHIPGGADKFAKLPNIDALPGMLLGKLTPQQWSRGPGPVAQASLIGADGRVRHVHSGSLSTLRDLYNAGASLCFSSIDHCDPELTTIVKSFSAAAAYPGGVTTTCYLSPPRAGSGMHFDSQHVFFMQMSGEKHWTIGRRTAWQDAPVNVQAAHLALPAVRDALASLDAAVAEPADTGLYEVLLKAGDVLYLPPGVWHDGRTLESHSFHYTLTFLPLSGWQVVLPYLRRALLTQPTLRRDLRFVDQRADGEPSRDIENAIVQLRDVVNSMSAETVETLFKQINTKEGPLDWFLKVP